MSDRRFSLLPRTDAGGPPEWAITFADMMTLILIFFIFMASYSNLDVIRYRKLLESVKEGFGGKATTAAALQDSLAQAKSGAQAAGDAEKALYDLAGKAGPGGPFELVRTPAGVRLRVQEGVMFDLGKAELRPEARPFLHRLAPILARYPGTVWVEGHTDDLPIQNQSYPSNWELSAARAGSVVRALAAAGGLSVNHLVAVGYADTRPLAPNQDGASRKRNRRVEFLLSPSSNP
jgi:chemotaxis protein MotB